MTSIFDPDYKNSGRGRLENIEDWAQRFSSGGSLSSDTGFAAEKFKAIYSGVTYKRSMLSVSFDDGGATDYSTLYPLLTARNLTAGFAIPQGFLDGVGKITTAQAKEMQGRGMEIMCHSRTHTYPTSFSVFQDETSGAQADMVTAGLNADSFVQPGWGTGGDGGTYYFDSLAKLDGRAGEWMRRYFANVSAYASDIDLLSYNNVKPAPARVKFGHTRLTIDSGWTLASLKIIVDTVVNQGGYIEFACHFAVIGTGGNLSLADLTSLLDYIQAYQDAGKLDVLTPTGAIYASPATAKTNLLGDGDFTLSATGAYVYWSAEAGSPTIAAGGALSGNYVQVDASNYLIQKFVAVDCRSVRFEGYAISATGSATTARLSWKVFDNANVQIGSTLTITYPNIAAAQVKCAATLGLPANAAYAQVMVMESGAGPAVRWSNVTLAKS